nr:immunoglobulin light chain junction region [Macaca mulatta]
CHQGNSIPWTF